MATGAVENWIDVDTLGAIYPFVGSEGLLVILGLAFWIGWHLLQMKKEGAEFKKDIENINRQGGPGKVLDEEASREMKDTVGS